MPLVLFAACAPPPDDAVAYPEALRALKRNAADAVAICAPVGDPDLEADCLTAGAEQVARRDAEGAAALCEAIPAGTHRDECLFQVAERSEELARCEAAGGFAEDCRLHLWTGHVRRAFKPGLKPGEVEDRAEADLRAWALDPEDMRYWSVLYREVLGRLTLLDRRLCAAASPQARAEACAQTGLALYQDRLNAVHHRGGFPCDPAVALPGLLRFAAPDAELEAKIAERRARGDCR